MKVFATDEHRVVSHRPLGQLAIETDHERHEQRERCFRVFCLFRGCFHLAFPLGGGAGWSPFLPLSLSVSSSPALSPPILSVGRMLKCEEIADLMKDER